MPSINKLYHFNANHQFYQLNQLYSILLGRNCNILSFTLFKLLATPYHDGKEDGDGGNFFDDPEHGKAGQLAEGEQVDSADGNLSEIGKVRLVLLRHEELKRKNEVSINLMVVT